MTSWGALLPSMFRATVLPWLRATSQCSTRIDRPPCRTLSYSAISPATNTSGTLVRRRESARTPPLSPSSRPAARARVTSGAAPTPITTASVSSCRPALVITRVTRPSAPSQRCLEEPARLLAKAPAERDRLDHHHRARAPELGQRCRHLAGDV